MGDVIMSLFILLIVPGYVRTGYINCGEGFCVDNEGVTCNSDGRCDCPPRTVGEARVVCVDPDYNCTCIMHGDPHVLQFTGNKIDLPLPCAHKIVDIQSKNGDQCRIQINGLAEFSNQGELSMRSVEKIVHLRVVWGPMEFTAVFKGNAPPTAQLRGFGTAMSLSTFDTHGVTVPDTADEAGYYSVTLEKCHMTLKFRATDGFLGLVTPTGVATSAGVCGRCTRGETSPPSQQQALNLLLDSLWRQSPVDGAAMNTDTSCRDLTKAVLDCPEGRVDFARGYCEVMLLDESIQKCIGEQVEGNAGTLARYALCYERVCNDGGTCSEYEGFLSGCGAEEHINKFMGKQDFCYKE